MSVKAELTERDRRYLERSLNGPVWKVVLSVGTPLALYQELAMIFTVMDTMMAAHISKGTDAGKRYTRIMLPSFIFILFADIFFTVISVFQGGIFRGWFARFKPDAGCSIITVKDH